MDFLKSLISALPSAAASPYAFVAYICVVVGWVVIALKVKRNGQLLAHLNTLPSQDRLAALQLEMGAVSIKESMTPEQWIKAQVHRYLFLGFAILCLAAVVLFVVAYTVRKPGNAEVDITPYDGANNLPNGHDTDHPPISEPTQGAPERVPSAGKSRANAGSASVTEAASVSPALVSFRKGGSDEIVDNRFDASSGTHIYGSGSEDLTLRYDYDRTDQGIKITPNMRYLSLLSQGGPISGVHYWHSAFAWQFPKLSIKVVNNTDRTLELTEVTVRVNKSEVDTDPILVFHENLYNVGHLQIVNEGWGKVLKPTFRLGIEGSSACNAYPKKDTPVAFSRDTFDEGDNLPIQSYVPLTLRLERIVCVFGTVQFTTERGAEKSVKFYALASLVRPGPGAPAPPGYLYDLFLESGKSRYTKRIPISEVVKPGDVDHFLIRIGTDRSASFDLSFSFVSKPVALKETTQVDLSILVPRTQAGAAHPRTTDNSSSE